MTRRMNPRKVAGGTPRADRDPPREPIAGAPPGEESALAAAVVRLTNRTAALTLAAAFAGIAAFVTVARAFATSSTMFGRLAATVLAAAAVVTFVAVWRARVDLRAARARAEGAAGETSDTRRAPPAPPR